MNYSIETFLEDIRQKFVDLSFDYKKVLFKGQIPVFFVYVQDEGIVKEQWMDVSKFIAGHFQSSLTDEFSVWNIYLFFMIQETISDDLKYTIENNTFSSRKIVIAPPQDIDTIIKEHILNNDLNIHHTIVAQDTPFNHNPNIWDDLNRIPPKKKVTDDITKCLDQIIEKIKTQES